MRENTTLELQNRRKPKSIYAGFWLRVGTSLLDFIYTLPVVLPIQYLNGLGQNIYFYTCIPNLLFALWYFVYLPKRYGGTPGQLSAGLAILKVDGKPINWREAIYRYFILAVLNICGIIITISALQKADASKLSGMNWWQQSHYLMLFEPLAFKIYGWAASIWMYSEFLVLLFNKKKRGLNDFIAGTVVVKKKYLYEINDDINTEINTIGSTMDYRIR